MTLTHVPETPSSQNTLDVTLFALRIEDQIIGSGNTSSNVDGKTKTIGLELSCQGEFARHWLLAANLTRQNGEDADGNDLVHRAKTIASINATYRSVSDMRITLGIYYNGSQTDSYFDSLFNRLPVRVDPYTVINLATSYPFSETVER